MNNAAYIVDVLLEAMNRRDFLRRLGIGGAAAVAAPAAVAYGLSGREAQITALYQKMAPFYWKEVERQLAVTGATTADMQRMLKDLKDTVIKCVDSGTVSTEAAQNSIRELVTKEWHYRAAEAIPWRKRNQEWEDERERSDNQWRKEKAAQEASKLQKEKAAQRQQDEWKRKHRKVYPSRQPQDRRGMDRPRVPYQGQPRMGEAQNAERVVNCLLEKLTYEDAIETFACYGVPNADKLSRQQLALVWRKLCLQHHPDKGGTNTAAQDINAAYDLLRAQAPEVVEPEPKLEPEEPSEEPPRHPFGAGFTVQDLQDLLRRHEQEQRNRSRSRSYDDELKRHGNWWKPPGWKPSSWNDE